MTYDFKKSNSQSYSLNLISSLLFFRETFLGSLVLSSGIQLHMQIYIITLLLLELSISDSDDDFLL